MDDLDYPLLTWHRQLRTCGICYPNSCRILATVPIREFRREATGRSGSVDSEESEERKGERMATHGKQDAESAAGSARGGSGEATAFERLYPRLAWELVSTVYGDGKTPREPSGFSLFQQDGMVKGVLRDRNFCKVAFRSALTVHDLLVAFEDALVKGSIEWREDKFGRKG